MRCSRLRYPAHRRVVESHHPDLAADREDLSDHSVEPVTRGFQHALSHGGEEEREAPLCDLARDLHRPTPRNHHYVPSRRLTQRGPGAARVDLAHVGGDASEARVFHGQIEVVRSVVPAMANPTRTEMTNV